MKSYLRIFSWAVRLLLFILAVVSLSWTESGSTEYYRHVIFDTA